MSDSTATEGLNKAQAEAVRYEDGPLIVLAGPGTGKTRVIISRVAHMIRERGIAPERIVATTFSVKAAEQLRSRLAAAVGASAAERVNAHTTHGLGRRLLRRYADRLDLPPVMTGESGEGTGVGGGGRRRVRSSELIDPAQSRRMLRRLILDEDLFGHARAGGLESIIAEVEALFAFFDDRALTPDDVQAASIRWRAAVENGTGPDGSPLDELALAAARDAQARFADFARLHRLFDEERRAAGLLTYGDLIMLPIRLLRRHPDVQARCRTEFGHWLVDEFQDVNLGQIELLRLLAPPSPTTDICVVGDDDQAIYGFRGADDRAFQRFQEIWTGARVVELSENYRSRPRIIAVANSVISRATERFAPDKRTVFPAGATTEPAGIVECVELATEFDDGEAIAALIRLDTATPTSTATGADKDEAFSRYAVVVRTRGDLDRVENALWLEGIPTVRREAGGAADEAGVKDVLAWVRLIISPREAWHARRVLLRPPIALSLETVNALEKRYRAEASRHRHELRGEGGVGGDPGEFPAWLRAAADDDPMAVKFCDWFDQFALTATQESAAATLMRIVRETGVIHADLCDALRRTKRVESIVAMLTFAEARQRRLPPPGGLREFMEYYDDLPEKDQGFGVAAVEDRLEQTQGTDDSDEVDAVRLTTAHSAKGLEFDTVFVPRVQPTHGYPQTSSRGDSEALADVAAAGLFEGADRGAKDKRLAEERRVFYVACTRAERRLVLLPKKMKGKSQSTHFVQELRADEAVRASVAVVGGGDVLERAAKVRGAHVGGGIAPGLARAGGAEEDAGGVRDRRRETFERARREVRLAAAGALARVDSPRASAVVVDEARAALAGAADHLAAIAAVEATGEAPPPVSFEKLTEPSRRAIAALVAASRAAPPPPSKSKTERGASAWATRSAHAPLELSFTAIDQYLRCPRCYYVRYLLGHDGPPGAPAEIGGAMHYALENFYNEFREADSVGERPPGLDRLLALARHEYLRRSPVDLELNAAELDKMLAQARLTFEQLHSPDIHMLEAEHTVRFEYVSAGVAHRMEAKIDRIDQITMPDGTAGFRIVDYKTGGASKARLTPEPDDLQLGIYTLGLRHEYGADVRGVAEYWLLGSGRRGVLPLESVDEAGVRETIDKAIAGILGGRFERGKDCADKVCSILDPPG